MFCRTLYGRPDLRLHLGGFPLKLVLALRLSSANGVGFFQNGLNEGGCISDYFMVKKRGFSDEER